MANTRYWSVVAAAFAALMLTACGGEVELGSTLGGGTTGGEVPTVADELVLLTSSPTLNSGAADVSAGVTLTAIVRDRNNNVVPGIVVVFGTADSAEIVVTNPAITDDTGRVTAVLTTGGDQENRTVTVAAAVAEAPTLNSAVNVEIVGTTLEVFAPTTAQFGVPLDFTVQLRDSSGIAVSGRTIQLATEPGNTIATSTLVSNAQGEVKGTLTLQNVNSSLTATALGQTDTATITASPVNFAITPRVSNPSQIGEVFTSLFTGSCTGVTTQPVTVTWSETNQDGSTLLISGQTVSFAATRGQFVTRNGNTCTVTPTTTRTTNAEGRVEVEIASEQAGFSTITASSEARSRPTTTTRVEFVARTPARIDVNGGPATVAANQTSEIAAVVRDARLNLVKNTTVEFSLSDLSTGSLSVATAVTNSQGTARTVYTAGSDTSATRGVTITGRVRGTNLTDSKDLTVGGSPVGIFIGTGSQIVSKDSSTYALPFTVVVTDAAGNPVPSAQLRLKVEATRYFEGTFEGISPPEGCPNEDRNNNDLLDDFDLPTNNDNDTLEPGRVASIPTSITLDPDGAGQFELTYPKDAGQFVEVAIEGTVTYDRSDTSIRRVFFLTVAQNDVDNLPGISPFGIDGDCSTYDPNGLPQ